MGYEQSPANNERYMGALYSLERDQSIKKHIDKLDLSNGLAWTADNTVMYFIDSIPRKVYAFDYNIDAGTICKQWHI